MFKKKNKFPPEATYGEVWSKGDIFAKLSFIIMGLFQLKNKQWLKGILFLASEIIIIGWLFFSGFSAISMLGTLGTVKTKKVVWDASQGVYNTILPDNSILYLLFGVFAIVAVALLIFLYIVHLRSLRHLYALNRDDAHIPTTLEDLSSLLDDRLYITLMALPLLGILAFTVAPLIFMITLAFTNYDSQHLIGFSWTGFSAFIQIFQGDFGQAFLPILAWTIIWAIASTVTTFLGGVLLALLIESKGIKFKGFWRTLFVVVFAVPQFVSLLLMAMFLDDHGPINTALENAHWIAGPIQFLSDPTLAKISVIGVNMWIGIPVTMLVSTAIIQNLSQDQIEAARIDGANSFQVFRSITFPQILFVLTPTLIQQFIGNFNNFNVIYLLTGGGPNTSNTLANAQAGTTDLLITWLYKLTTQSTRNYAVASAIGIIIFVITATASLALYRRTNAFKEG
ncbi:carbohydrate ABC transporter permease [Lactococcus allomyrinae]|uniref:Maltose/maltodextrin transport system permease protein n=1 Tax=Lactococcus allomyrinae TaxID=2419773 RepID=A0A387BIL2_9LACT|nr:sugar ABC transporter permease [Lactococcus allomyrinae]AYG00730.1 sugar ABC transporter permease [Lactococcus allomyrinae]